MAGKNQYKPGEKAPRSGRYEITGPRGGRTGIERTVTRGEPLPHRSNPASDTRWSTRRNTAVAASKGNLK